MIDSETHRRDFAAVMTAAMTPSVALALHGDSLTHSLTRTAYRTRIRFNCQIARGCHAQWLIYQQLMQLNKVASSETC